jgi:hypothetical protein
MRSKMRLFVLALSTAVGVAVWGCGGPKSWEGGGYSLANGENNGVKYSFWCCDLTADDRVYFVILGDNSSGGSLSAGPTASGWLDIVDGRKIAWSCTTQDGTKGPVTIDGQRFDLRNGAIFLVSAKEQKTKVDQLAVEMSKLHRQSAGADLLSLAETQPRIASYFMDMRGNK